MRQGWTATQGENHCGHIHRTYRKALECMDRCIQSCWREQKGMTDVQASHYQCGCGIIIERYHWPEERRP